MSAAGYEAVIGLEVHVQIRTRSKMFSRSACAYGEPSNTLTDPVVLGLPGALPVMNLAAIEAVIRAGLMLGCDIAPVCKWDRKNYFYPDSAKNYQISQYDQPICRGGSVEIELPGRSRNVMGEHKRIALTRIHLEEDVGKLVHAGRESLVDFNRAGTPLMEIVSEPVMRSAEEAHAFLTALRIAMVCGGISECDMEKGQMRCDANISIRPAGSAKLGTKVELKNMNSIAYVRDGITHEIARQAAVVEAGGAVVQETRDYDGEAGASRTLRSKEEAHDYRYFPDPDLMPVVVDEAWKARLGVICPEMPFDRQRRLQAEYGIPYTITSVLVPDPDLSRLFEETAKIAGRELAQAVGNWISNHLLRELGSRKISLEGSGARADRIAELVAMVETGSLPVTAVAQLSSSLVDSRFESAPGAIAERDGLKASAVDPGDLERWCREAIAANPKALADYKGGKDSAINGFKGPVMRAAKGKADPRLVDETLRRLLAQL